MILDWILTIGASVLLGLGIGNTIVGISPMYPSGIRALVGMGLIIAGVVILIIRLGGI